MKNFALSPATNDKLKSLLNDYWHLPKPGNEGGFGDDGRSFQQVGNVQCGTLVDSTPMYHGTPALFDSATRTWTNQTGSVYVVAANFGTLAIGSYYSAVIYGEYANVPVYIVEGITTCIPIVTNVVCDGSTLTVTKKYLYLPSFTLSDTPCP